MAKRKLVTVSMTFETVFEVDEDALKKAQYALEHTPAGIYLHDAQRAHEAPGEGAGVRRDPERGGRR